MIKKKGFEIMKRHLMKFGQLKAGDHFSNLCGGYFVKLKQIVGVDALPCENPANAVEFMNGGVWYFEDIAPVYILGKEEPQLPF